MIRFASVVAAALLAAAPAAAQRVISTPNAPAAIGPYSQAIQAGPFLFLAGQIAIDPATNEVKRGTIEEETKLVLDNLKAVVEAAGMTMANIVSTTVFMADLNEFPRMNAVYATYFPTNPPARATVQVARLPRDVKIEIAAIAYRAP
ncbi:RidA family protein [Elioraea tepida]|jgi:2-iminobutanoate/2-iminopropanoate deaminase|uniref:RidA family protein n=1 Tax=Elioraea tepida TaxID=2843330 RepID=A0A975U111_9PROT|nr:RidA family protein [Elioraea tepida]QXM23388.1 RidA family protein [Elioraea tepida]